MLMADLMTIPGKLKLCLIDPMHNCIIYPGLKGPPNFVTEQNVIMYDYKINKSQFK